MQLLQDEFAKHGQEGPFEKWLKHWDPEHDVFAAPGDDAHRMLEVLRPARRRAARARHPDRPERATSSPRPSNGSSGCGRPRNTSWPARGCRCHCRRPTCSRGSRRELTHRDARVGLLADDAPRDTGPDFGKASPFGLLVVVLLLIGTFLLVWSMNRHLKKLPESFDPRAPRTRPGARRRDRRATRSRQTASRRSEPRRLTRLRRPTSPYLRQHADNPVHWQQWTPEALAEAARATCRSCCRSATRRATGVT